MTSMHLFAKAYYYYQRTMTGKDYVQHCRRLVPIDGPITVHDVMPTGPDAPPEHIILDENVKAQGHDYYSIGAFKASPNNKLIAYAQDTKGDEIYTVYVIDADSGEYVGQPLKGITSDIEWAVDDHLVYITMDNILRPDKVCQFVLFLHDFFVVEENTADLFIFVWLHKLGSDQSSDTCLYHEEDDTFSLGLQASESKQYLFVESGSKNTSFIFYLDTSKQNKDLVVLTSRVCGIDTMASHRGNHFFIKRRSDEFYNSELVACPLDNVAETTVLLPHRESVKIQDFQLFDNISLYTNVRMAYPSSMRTPPSVFDYDMDSGVSVLKKINTVLGGFDASNYVTERKWAAAADGTQVPMSILYRKDLVKLDGSDPMLLYGYGSYEVHFVGAAVAGVPFVDVLTTMLDPTIPLTTAEWEEWGDPRKEDYYYYMKSYSPVDNVRAQEYPNILVTAGLNDPRVMYSEPAKYVARLRELKTDDNLLLFKCELGAGHFSKSGRFEKLQEDAFTYAFILKALGMTPNTN
ncbi:hypothetical protein PR202_gb28543 [Eleusine coracana subsp. coracana]|uniref:Prolyl endopeptidase-like n=1 Tax=Eleusine coracana subsp. coracana TaxID=191504 RepID=A0AAV5FXJ4_ELECO|nr:hypothetical protein PR202_gb28543 [Eleusine coracana subsp. coracana]